MTILFRFFLFILLLLLTPVLQVAQAYDSPDFDFEIFDRDALRLSANDRETIVEVLNAVVCNFPESDLIDEDLREKALALAIALDPLNANARNAHTALSADRIPKKTAFFQSSVSEVAERLWSESVKMSGKNGEPEGRKLAEYLEEISLLLHPGPPSARVRSFVANSEKKTRKWDKFLQLQPDSNPSNSKLESLIEGLREKRGGSRKEDAPTERKKALGPRPAPVVELDGIEKAAPESVPFEVKLSDVEIPFVASLSSGEGSGYLGGLASIAAKREKEDGDMRLSSASEGFRILGMKEALQLVRKDFPALPGGMRAKVRFDSDLPTELPKQKARANCSVAAGLLLYSVVSGSQPLPDLVVAGFTDDPLHSVFTVGSEIGKVIDQAKAMGAEFLLVPESQYEFYLKGAVETGQLEYLFEPQLISWSDWDQLKSTVFGEDTASRAVAAAEFRKIQAVQDQMALVDLARNAKVQERLEKIVEEYPQHLSARVMLDFGKAPAPE